MPKPAHDTAITGITENGTATAEPSAPTPAPCDPQPVEAEIAALLVRLDAVPYERTPRHPAGGGIPARRRRS